MKIPPTGKKNEAAFEIEFWKCPAASSDSTLLFSFHKLGNFWMILSLPLL